MTAAKKLIILGTLSEILYLGFYLFAPFRKYMGDSYIMMSSCTLFFVMTGMLIALTLLCAGMSAIKLDKSSFKIGIIFFLIFNASVLFIRPLSSLDAFTYIHTSRVLSVHHANPYIAAFDDFPNDPIFKTLKNCWSSFPTPYAPLFTVISTIITFVGQKSLWFSLYLFKLLFIACNIASCYIIHKVFKSKKATLMYAWSPLILFEVGINGHNDALTILFMLLSFYFLYKKSEGMKSNLLSYFFLLCSFLIKYITAFLLPVHFFLILFSYKALKEKVRYTASISLVTAIVLFVAYFPFWEGIQVMTRSVSHTGNVYAYNIFASPLILIAAALLSTFNITHSSIIHVYVGKIVFLVAYLFDLIVIFCKRFTDNLRSFSIFALITLGIFYFSFFTWIMPWYYTCLITLIIINYARHKSRYYIWAINLITFYCFCFYLILR